MNTAIVYWLTVVKTLWDSIKINPILSIGIVSVFFGFVIKYFDKIKEIFK